jgi:hypothetical protein
LRPESENTSWGGFRAVHVGQAHKTEFRTSPIMIAPADLDNLGEAQTQESQARRANLLKLF